MHTLQQALTTQVEQELGYCTKMLQIDSLVRFMDKIGYHTSLDSFWDKEDLRELTLIFSFYRFRSDDYTWNNPNFISFQDAVRLHNNKLYKVVGDKVYPRYVRVLGVELCFSRDVLDKATQSKLVAAVKLQRKKGGAILVQSNFVKLVNT